MNEYGFDYLNYVTNIPNNMNYSKNKAMNYMQDNQIKFHMPNQAQMLDPYQGFIKGNLFANLYDGYKNYKPEELNPSNEKDALMYQLMQYKFALIDLNLYLDTHPDDNNVLNLYQQYLTIEKQMCNKYESMYGPITLDSVYLGNNSWNWDNNPWPWEEM